MDAYSQWVPCRLANLAGEKKHVYTLIRKRRVSPYSWRVYLDRLYLYQYYTSTWARKNFFICPLVGSCQLWFLCPVDMPLCRVPVLGLLMVLAKLFALKKNNNTFSGSNLLRWHHNFSPSWSHVYYWAILPTLRVQIVAHMLLFFQWLKILQ